MLTPSFEMAKIGILLSGECGLRAKNYVEYTDFELKIELHPSFFTI